MYNYILYNEGLPTFSTLNCSTLVDLMISCSNFKSPSCFFLPFDFLGVGWKSVKYPVTKKIILLLFWCFLNYENNGCDNLPHFHCKIPLNWDGHGKPYHLCYICWCIYCNCVTYCIFIIPDVCASARVWQRKGTGLAAMFSGSVDWKWKWRRFMTGYSLI